MFCSGLARASDELQKELQAIKLTLKEQKATEERLRDRLTKQDVTSSKRKEVAWLVLLQSAAHALFSYTTVVHVLPLCIESTHVLQDTVKTQGPSCFALLDYVNLHFHSGLCDMLLWQSTVAIIICMQHQDVFADLFVLSSDLIYDRITSPSNIGYF